jgi:hypothetical protein
MIDKSTWGEGPWQTEPDELDWTDAVTGLRCRILRNPRMGMLCGYVEVPPEHPLFGRHYDGVNARVEVHGGATFAEEEDGLWWIGFDCGHTWDIAPGMDAMLPPYVRERNRGRPVVYRSFDYVHDQCTALAWQIHQLAEKPEAT